MPNAEYLRLKQLRDSDPQIRTFLDTISKAEGTWGKDAYSTKYGGRKIDWAKGKDRTSNGVSNAHGKYQFMNDTWDSLAKTLGLTGFTPEEQDIAAIKLLEDSGALAHLNSGDIKGAIFSASRTWSSLPKSEKGGSAHTFKNGKKQPAKSLKTVMDYMMSDDDAFFQKNDKLKKLNSDKWKNASEEERERIFKNYNKRLNEINSDPSLLTEADKNFERQALKQKYYRSGNFDIIQHKYYNIQKGREQIAKDLEKLMPQSTGSGITDFLSSFGAKDFEGNPISKPIDKNKYAQIVKKAKALNIELPSIEKANADTVAQTAKSIRDLNVNKIEKDPSKYGYTREEFDDENYKNTPDGNFSDDTSGSSGGSNTETAEEKAVREKAEAAAKAKEAEKNKPFTGSDRIDWYNTPEEFVDPKFEYVPGKEKFPFESLIGLTSGLMGAASANSVHTKERDERISDGLLLYAQDLAKIKNMGLDPSMEADLKMKLSEAYQTGLENIVRASNGNRNLVLGNQGQLDRARMAGIVAIAAMDVERTDKAMANFGEVQKYINEFESNRDIANNDRKYQEDMQKKALGAEVASQGLSQFISAIENAKENGPGSLNDMRRQYFQFHATGLLPNAKPGKIGSKEYRTQKEIENKAFSEKKQSFAQWINSMTLDEQDIVTNILIKNPNLDLAKNKEASLDLLKQKYNEVSGTDEYKSEYQRSKGISDAKSKVVDDAADAVIGKNLEKPVKERQHVSSVADDIKPVGFASIPTPPRASSDLKISDVIITDKKVPDNILLDQLAKGANGKQTGINTLTEAQIEQEQMRQQREEMNNLILTQKQNISKMNNTASEVLKLSQHSNGIIDQITNNALNDVEKLKLLIH